MLKYRVIPSLLWSENTLVKGERFDSWRTVGGLLQAVKVFAMRDVDELIILSIKASEQGKMIDLDVVKQAALASNVPLTVGGGVKDVLMIRNLLNAGADKVTINSSAFNNSNFISHASKKFGSQCIVVSIDVLKEANNKYQCYSHSAQKATGWDPVKWAAEVEHKGAGEILLTSINRDGTMKGYDLELIKSITNVVNIPVIASGGAGCYEDFLKAIKDSNASAVAAGAMFQFTEQTPREAKLFLSDNNIPVRKGPLPIILNR